MMTLSESIRKLFNQPIFEEMFLSNTLLEGSVKLTFTQLEGESIAAISVPLEAKLKLEWITAGKGCQKVLFYLYENGFFRLRNKG